MRHPTSRAQPTPTSNAAQAIRVMIVDDHELLREGLRQLIIGQPRLEVCGEASNEREARSRFRVLRPDLVVVDLSLRESSGLDLIKWIRQERPATKVIVSTMHDERDYGERSLRAGAVGYVNKQSPARTILAAIAQVLEGKLFFSEVLTSRLLCRVASRSPTADGSPVAALSDRELEVFSLIGAGLTTDLIAERLHLSPHTIGTYRERLKTKLNLKGSAELSHFATLWVAENA